MQMKFANITFVVFNVLAVDETVVVGLGKRLRLNEQVS